MLKNSGQLSQLNPKHITQQTNVAPKDGMWKGLQQEHSWRRKNIFLLLNDKVLTPRWSSTPPPPPYKTRPVWFALALLYFLCLSRFIENCANHVSLLILFEQERRRQTFLEVASTLLYQLYSSLKMFNLSCSAGCVCVCVRRLFRLEFGWFRL